MKLVLGVFAVIHGLIAAMFAGFGVSLIAIAAAVAWEAFKHGLTVVAAQEVIESIGLLAAAVVGLQISQTIVEEEVMRDAHISAPTRVRRFLSRFFVVVVVALVIEALVATFKAVHENLEQLLYGASLLLSSAALLAAWGYFVRCNRYAEELEPEAMQEAKREDHKVR